MKHLLIISSILALLGISCTSTEEGSNGKQAEGRIPVTIVHISKSAMTETIDLNATSVFTLKTFIKSNTNGYLQEVNVQLGQNISKGNKMFVIRSKESQNIGNTVMQLDTSFHFSGLVTIHSPGNGYVTQLTYRPGDYVQDGETLAAISDVNSLVFMLELPYELKPYLPNNNSLEVLLPDGQKLIGAITSSMPLVDQVSQTQNYIIRVQSPTPIPENLIATVRFIKKTKPVAISVPKDAVLTNEVQSEFWIMKMTDSITAVKVPIVKGIETADWIEVVSPILHVEDKIIIKGNYGMPDTAKVVIENVEQP